MILGIGHDVVDIRRIEALLQKNDAGFVKRVFTLQEQAYAKAQPFPAYAYAKRFAAKEAFAKALGHGIRSPLFWTDMDVIKDPLGKPSIILAAAKEHFFFAQLGAFKSFLSLSDEPPYAHAFVILEHILPLG